VPERFIVLEGAYEHNLKNIDIRIPVGVFTARDRCIRLGKSTMVIETLYRVLARRLNLQKALWERSGRSSTSAE